MEEHRFWHADGGFTLFFGGTGQVVGLLGGSGGGGGVVQAQAMVTMVR